MTGAEPFWIAADWGTSALRLWRMAGDGRVLADVGSDAGMGRLPPDGFEPELLCLARAWLDGASAPVRVVICGMAGARQGWREAPYRAVPCAPIAAPLQPVAAHDPRIAVHIVPGLSQARPADVMRGEETQIAGFLRRRPDFDGVLCLPGTHTKWAQVSAGEVVAFQTCMTGELFALLGQQSVLRHSLAGEGWDAEAFGAAVEDAMTAPARLSSRLFALRAEALLEGLLPATARARLSGLLLGLELAGSRPYWLGQAVAIIGAPGLAATYAAALQVAGLAAELTDATGLTLDGLRAAHAMMETRR